MNNPKTQIKIVIGTLWGLLGFKRGINEYNYYNEKYNEKNKENPKLDLYTNKIPYGFMSTLFYINPFLVPIKLYKELYRLEVNIRGLESEKKSDYYNEL
jgi:hypothetical protein